MNTLVPKSLNLSLMIYVKFIRLEMQGGKIRTCSKLSPKKFVQII